MSDWHETKETTQKFTDAQGHDLTMRTYPSSDSYYVRVYDDKKTPEPPEFASYGDASRANLHLERDASGNVKRARLQDIETLPPYRGAGTGSRVLKQCEDIARQNGASEIYGDFTSEEGKEKETRKWYAKRGYAFRQGGQEVYKKFEETDHATGKKLTPRGEGSMKGHVDVQGHKASEDLKQPDNDDDLGTTHPRKHPETPTEPERQPTTIIIKDREKSKPKPPEGWHPDPERGG